MVAFHRNYVALLVPKQSDVPVTYPRHISFIYALILHFILHSPLILQIQELEMHNLEPSEKEVRQQKSHLELNFGSKSSL